MTRTGRLVVVCLFIVVVGGSLWYWARMRKTIAFPLSQPVKESLLGSSNPVRSLIAADIYGAQTLSTQRLAVRSAHGDLRFDASVIEFHSAKLCNYLADRKWVDLKSGAAAGKYPTDKLSLASYEMVDSYRNRFCGSQKDLRQVSESDYVALAAIEAANSGSRHAQTIITALESVEKSGALPNAEQLRGALLGVLRNTQSPGLMTQAVELLAEPEFGGFTPEGFQYGDLSDDQAYLVTMFGLELASCQEFNYCNGVTPYSIRACMPSDCRGSGTLADYIRNRLSPTEFDAAQRYASALRAMRN